MSKTLREYITINFCVLATLGAEVKNISNVFPNTSVFTAKNDTNIAIDETQNRLPAIITDAKLLMSEVIISDFNSPYGVNGRYRVYVHQGVDIIGYANEPILAMADGIVLETAFADCVGPNVVIDHGLSSDNKRLIAIYSLSLIHI